MDDEREQIVMEEEGLRELISLFLCDCIRLGEDLCGGAQLQPRVVLLWERKV